MYISSASVVKEGYIVSMLCVLTVPTFLEDRFCKPNSHLSDFWAHANHLISPWSNARKPPILWSFDLLTMAIDVHKPSSSDYLTKPTSTACVPPSRDHQHHYSHLIPTTTAKDRQFPVITKYTHDNAIEVPLEFLTTPLPLIQRWLLSTSRFRQI